MARTWHLDYETVGYRAESLEIVELDAGRPPRHDPHGRCADCLAGARPEKAGSPGWDEWGRPIRLFSADACATCSGCIVGMMDETGREMRCARGSGLQAVGAVEDPPHKRRSPGRPKSRERGAVEEALRQHPVWSDRQVAAHCGVGKTLVGDIRRESGRKTADGAVVAQNGDFEDVGGYGMRGDLRGTCHNVLSERQLRQQRSHEVPLGRAIEQIGADGRFYDR